jgi:hypothetical protein
MKDGREVTKNIRARDIVDFWDDYATEHERRIALNEERKRQEREREEQREQENELIRTALIKCGIPASAISVQNDYSSAVYLSRTILLTWIRESVDNIIRGVS